MAPWPRAPWCPAGVPWPHRGGGCQRVTWGSERRGGNRKKAASISRSQRVCASACQVCPCSPSALQGPAASQGIFWALPTRSTPVPAHSPCPLRGARSDFQRGRSGGWESPGLGEPGEGGELWRLLPRTRGGRRGAWLPWLSQPRVSLCAHRLRLGRWHSQLAWSLGISTPPPPPRPAARP